MMDCSKVKGEKEGERGGKSYRVGQDANLIAPVRSESFIFLYSRIDDLSGLSWKMIKLIASSKDEWDVLFRKLFKEDIDPFSGINHSSKATFSQKKFN